MRFMPNSSQDQMALFQKVLFFIHIKAAKNALGSFEYSLFTDSGYQIGP
jgi:hypothetical protein